MDQRHCAQKLRLLPPSPPEQMHHFPLLRVRFEMPEKIIQPSLFFEHLQAQVQLHMASEGRNVSASLLLLFFVLENA